MYKQHQRLTIPVTELTSKQVNARARAQKIAAKDVPEKDTNNHVPGLIHILFDHRPARAQKDHVIAVAATPAKMYCHHREGHAHSGAPLDADQTMP